MSKYKVRYNLGRGVRFMTWQVRHGYMVEHHIPEEVTLVMLGCKLINKRKEAEKIFEGGYKRVCSWVECEEVRVLEDGVGFSEPVFDSRTTEEVKYNPRLLPYWNIDGKDVDGQEFDIIYTEGRKLFAIHENKT